MKKPLTQPMLFDPYTGRPRHPSDIASDPQGILMIDPDETLRPYVAQPDKDAEIAALKKENEAFKAVTTTWTGAANDFRDAVLHGLDGWTTTKRIPCCLNSMQFCPFKRCITLS